MLPANFVYLGVLLIIIGDGGYLIDTLKGRVKPNKVTWFFWGLAPLIAFFAQFSQGVGISTLFTLTFVIMPFLVLVAAYVNKKSVWTLTKFDYACGGLSLAGLVLWAITKNPNTALVLSIIADLFASIPTYKKSYTNPETETYKVYLFSGLAGLTTLLTINKWQFSSVGFPIYVIILNIFFIITMKLGLAKKKKK